MAYRGYYSTPGLAPRPAATPFQAPAMPTFAPPPKPTGAVAERGLRPVAQAQEKDILGRMGSLSSKYQSKRTMAIGQTKSALAGYGRTKVNDDGSITSDPTGEMGQFYKDAYTTNRDAANARGLLDSSFAAKAIGAAFGRLTADQQAIVTQHAGVMNQLVAEEASEYNELNTSLLTLYGSEAEYLIDNPPPLPEPAPEPAAAPAGGGGGGGGGHRWTGKNPPNKQSLAKQWGVPVSQIGVGRTKDGTYVAAIKRS